MKGYWARFPEGYRGQSTTQMSHFHLLLKLVLYGDYQTFPQHLM